MKKKTITQQIEAALEEGYTLNMVWYSNTFKSFATLLEHPIKKRLVLWTKTFPKYFKDNETILKIK